MDSSTHRALFVPGTVIADRYEVIDTVGKGGMGIVMRVNDRALNNEVVALKLLYPHMAKDQTQFARFQNEVLIARKLAHPNIVRLYDFGSAGQGYYYITMEYVEGGSLGGRIYGPRHQRMSLYETLETLLEICAGLSCAHSMGIVHRDLKPDNILLTITNAVKLSDFGLARTVGTDKGLTQTGDTVGTPYYMAPEQLRGERPDHRVDIYALGILTYELVVGQRPFVHDNYLQLAGKHVRDPIPKFASKESGIPQWMQEFVERASAKHKDNRFQSAEEAAQMLREHLAEAANSQVQRAPAVMSMYAAEGRPRAAFPWKAVGAGALVAATSMLMMGGVMFYRNNSQASTTAQVAQLPAQVAPDGPLTVKESFFKKIKLGQADYVKMMLETGEVGPNEVDEAGVPALHRAIMADQIEVAKVILQQRGADQNSIDAKGNSALDVALQLSNKRMETLLRGYRAETRRMTDSQRVEVKGALPGASAGSAPVQPAQTLTLRKFGKVTVFRSAGGRPAHIDFSVWNSSPFAARDLKLTAYEGSKPIGSFAINLSVEPNSKPALQVTETDLNTGQFQKVLEKESRVRFKVGCSNCSSETDLD